jgi:DNA-binding IclR family transcriptional regulator
MKNSEHLKDKVIETIEQVLPLPVDPQYVAARIGVSWSTARHLLMQLVTEGRLEAEKTTKGWIFRLSRVERPA